MPGPGGPVVQFVEHRVDFRQMFHAQDTIAVNLVTRSNVGLGGIDV
jgi:hypothetical protein